MSIVRVFAGLLAAVAVGSAAQAAPLEAYGKLPSIEAVAISPSGNTLAYIATNGEQRAIVVKDLVSNQFTFRTFVGTAKVRRIQWADDKHLLIASSVTAIALNVIAPKSEFTAGFILDLDKRRLQQMMQGVGPSAMNVIADFPVVRTVDGKPTVFVEGISFTGGSGRLSLFRVDVERASAKLALSGIQDVRDWVVGADGEPVAQELYDGRTGLWTLRVREPGGWRDAVTLTAPNDPPDVLGLGRDGRSVLYAMPEADGGVTWREARLDGAPPGAPLRLLGNLAPILDPGDGRVIGQYAMVGEEARYSFFEENDNRLWNAVVGAFPGDRVTLASWSADHRKVVAYVDSPKDGPAYALVDLNTRQASWLGSQYADLKAPDIAERRLVRFKAADGLDLTGYLTLPRGRDPKNLPLVVFPHGGPAARDDPGFDWWAQGMASRGYAVLQVNFRGSAGFGRKFLEAGFGEWGRKMQTDLSDGVRHLAGQGVVDPKRVCVVGASYGGYAALAGAAFDPGVYRCAASVAGVTDLRRMVSRGGDASRRYWTRYMGAEDVRDPKLAAISPAAHAGRVSIPILLVHGRDDTVVPLEQSRFMAEALKDAGKSYELVVQPGADHWLSRGDTRLQTLQAVVAFLEKHNPAS